MKPFAKIRNGFQLLLPLLPKLVHADAYLEQIRTSKLVLFAKIGNSFQPLTVIAKSSILNIRLGSEHVSG